MIRNPNPVTIQRKDYQAPAWLVPQTRLQFELDPVNTVVSSELTLRRAGPGSLVLDGVDLELDSVTVDGSALAVGNYRIENEQLIIDGLPDECVLRIVNRINPEANTALEGLYRSSGNFCTQCEAQGFRKITYFPDRPDVLSTFTVSIVADAMQYPVLLSNGNFNGVTTLDDGRQRAEWFDPFPKPSYLFALVAGKLSHIKRNFVTRSGRSVELYIYVEEHNIDKCDYAMDALIRSMKWDEDVYGLEYDLDRFMIVAVDDFNMGAMENKGLNIFNSKYVLANEETATDEDFLGVEAVVAHEYFHNWTGNRVTCRDWFQLSLKEGLTVFRDQEFSSDMHSRTVKRIEDVRLLRARQFPEDASPMAHPIRPDSFIEINNFYTLTVYEKGAEVIRMIHTLLGAQDFRKGIDLYFERHDGQAVTCDDFLAAMQDASGVDLSQFSLWYSTAGTPQLHVSDEYDSATGRYTLTLKQSTPDTPGQGNKPALHIPLKIGLLDNKGQALPLATGRADGDGSVLDVTQAEQRFVFDNIEHKPVASLLRGFSAPVSVHYECSEDTLIFQLAHDSDSFNRWEAGQRLASDCIESCMQDNSHMPSPAMLDAFAAVVGDAGVDAAFKAEVLSMPSVDTIASKQKTIDIAAIHRARQKLLRALAQKLQLQLLALVQDSTRLAGNNTMGERRLANTALRLLGTLDTDAWLELACAHYDSAGNMTDRVAALSVLCDKPGDARDARLQDFYQQWQDHRLVIDKWFAVQAAARHDGVLDDVIRLESHPAFEHNNPNRLRSLIGVYAMSNPVQLHCAGDAGYELVAAHVKRLDKTNPQIAARLVTPFLQWQRFCQPQTSVMQRVLQGIAAVDELSPDVYEVVSKALDGAG